MIDSNYNNTEVLADLPEEQTSQSSVKVCAARSKAKAKPQKREFAELTSTIPMNERKWIDIEPGESSLSAYEVSKKVINVLRHCQTVQREDDGAVKFLRIKSVLQNQFPQIHYWSDDRWKACLAGGGGSKRRYQYCSDISGTIVYLRALQGHYGISGDVVAFPDASSSAPYPQELNQWNSSIEEPLHTSTVEKSERPEQNRDLRCQSGPSAKNSVIFSGGDSSKISGADQQRLQISDLHFDKFPTPATFACWKIRFKTEVCSCSQFSYESNAMDQRSGVG